MSEDGAAPRGPTLLKLGHPRTIEPAFDDHHPPSVELAADCVHCGFCLPTCPMDSCG